MRATNLAYIRSRPKAAVDYEPMFASMKSMTTAMAGAFDLAIEFSTLGEYGLEYPAGATTDRRGCREEGRRRKAPGSPARVNPFDCRNLKQRESCSSMETDFASALRPPRIKLSFVD